MNDIKTNNVWLMKGDCLEQMKGIPDGSVDLILTDPPYGTTACKWDSVIPLDKMWEQLKRIIKHNGAIVLFGSQPFTSVLITSNLKMFKYEWIWEKSKASNFLLAKKQVLKAHENLLVFGKGSVVYYPQKHGANLIREKKEQVKKEALQMCIMMYQTPLLETEAKMV